MILTQTNPFPHTTYCICQYYEEELCIVDLVLLHLSLINVVVGGTYGQPNTLIFLIKSTECSQTYISKGGS